MSAQLIRALQRGGCAVQFTNHDWKVWRRPDRRGQAVGVLAAADIEMLRLQGDLAIAGGYEDGRLIWSGTVAPLPVGKRSSAALFEHECKPVKQCQPLLYRLLVAIPNPVENSRLAQAARDFAEDIERSQTSGRASGMNWQVLVTGTRIQGGTARTGGGRAAYAASSALRLEKLFALLGAQDFRLLERLVVETATRNAIARWRGMRPHEVQARALAVLRQLASAYDNRIKQPKRARMQRPVSVAASKLAR